MARRSAQHAAPATTRWWTRSCTTRRITARSRQARRRPLRPGGASLARTIRGIEYRVELPEGAPDAALRLAEFAAREDATVLRAREGKQPVRIDLKKSVDRLVAENAREIRFTLRAGENEAVARPGELLAALFGTELTRPGVARIVRENAIFGVPAA